MDFDPDQHIAITEVGIEVGDVSEARILLKAYQTREQGTSTMKLLSIHMTNRYHMNIIIGLYMSPHPN